MPMRIVGPSWVVTLLFKYSITRFQAYEIILPPVIAKGVRFPLLVDRVRILAIRNGSRWFAASDQAEKNRSVKNILLRKEGHHANSTARFE
jgi:hypothetical protein